MTTVPTGPAPLAISLAQPWHTFSPGEVAQRLDTDAARGLTPEVAKARQEEFGPNELTAKPGKPPWLRFLLQFNQPLLYILLLAGGVALVLQDWIEAGVIFAVTVINAIIGFVQESKAESAIAALAEAVTTEATILRDGQKQQIPSSQLVPGDLVLLASGDKVPADLRLIQVRNLQISEAALTGESVPVEKTLEPLPEDTPLAERTNMAYSGSLVTFGQGRGLVVAIANATETGRISQLMEQSSQLSTPLTRKFDRFSKTLLYVILGLAAFTFAVGLGYGEPWAAVFNAAIALAVSAIPEGLPAVVTITLAIGVSRMARRHAILRKLPAVETLGSTTVICSDKTGTLTENQMTVQDIYAGGQHYKTRGSGYAPGGEIRGAADQPVELNRVPALRDCLLAGLLCNDSHLVEENGQWSVVGDPTEAALLVAAQKVGLEQRPAEAQYPRLDIIPFESEFQYMATLHTMEGETSIYVKGSVEAVLPRCHQLLNADREAIPLNPTTIETIANQMAHQGLRVLAFAMKPVPLGQETIDHGDIDEKLIFLGLQGMIDPPRQEAIAAVKACQRAGIQVKMITGDHALTAGAIAQQMGIAPDDPPLVYTGQQLSRMNDAELAEAVERSMVFARVAPEQKLRLVKALQSKGEVVAMTGDGVNDAPALKQSDVGVAMGITGTEVAKEAADMVLTDDNFASIEAAVEEGRTVYQNLLKAIAFILPVNGGESMTVLISVLLGRMLPILPVQILWLNMVNSVTMTVPIAFEPKSSGTMQRPPRRPDEPLLSGSLIRRILVISAFNWIVIFGVFEGVLQASQSEALARSMAINALVFGRVVYLLSIGQFLPALIARLQGQREPLGVAIVLGTAAALLLQILFSQWAPMNQIFDTAPMTVTQWLICLGIGLLMTPVALLLNRFEPIR